MIPKEQRERDAAIASKATKGRWRWWTSNSYRRLRTDDGGPDIAYGHTHKDGCGDIAISDEDMAAIENAVNCLPAYIMALDEVDRRIERVEKMITEVACRAYAHMHAGEPDDAVRCREQMAALKRAVRILRGEA